MFRSANDVLSLSIVSSASRKSLPPASLRILTPSSPYAPTQSRSNRLGRPLAYRKRPCRFPHRDPYGSHVSHPRELREGRAPAVVTHGCAGMDCGDRTSGECGITVCDRTSGFEVWDWVVTTSVSTSSLFFTGVMTKAYVFGIKAAVDDGGDGGCVGSYSESTEKGGLRLREVGIS